MTNVFTPVHDDESTARLLVRCADQPGIVATISNFLYTHGANITALDQHSTDPSGGTFFMRLEFQLPHSELPQSVLERSFQRAVADRYDMDWHIHYAAEHKKTVLFVSRQDHALMELLWRWSRGEMPMNLTMVVSNHEATRAAVESFNIPFHYVPVLPGNKTDAEAQILELIEGQADLVVLARYMQILTPEFVEHYSQRIINIHHSFLPAFVGANPYARAAERGVKLIGATAHYVTEILDEGPIIEQDVIRVTHRQSVADLKELGAHIERQVLARAVRWHLEDRVIVHGNKTVVFA
jgi:formyltetrahydrofolate deformylase